MSQGRYFHYCSKGLPDGEKLEFNPGNRVYLAMQSLIELQLYCMGSFQKCAVFKGDFKGPGGYFIEK